MVASMPIDRPHHATTINYFLRSLHRILEEQDDLEAVTRTRTRGPPASALMSARRVRSADYPRYVPVVPVIPTVITRDRTDIPLRAKSVCLSERPRSNYARNIRSADTRSRHPDKQFFLRPQPQTKSRPKTNKVVVKQQKRKVIEKVPCAISVQNLAIPMKYADNTRHPTSKNTFDRSDYKTKPSNPPKQVSDNKRLCSTLGCGKETENKLLVQICEAEQVSDFERILNSNAILCERANGHVWRGCAAQASSASLFSQPRSSFSVQNVSQTYYHLFQQHEDSLQPLIRQYRESRAAGAPEPEAVPNILQLQGNWFETLQDLSEFYEDDKQLQEEIEAVTEKIVTEEVKAETARNINFNVNLTDLISLRVSGEGYSPLSVQDGPSSDVDKGTDYDEDKEWLGASMSENSEFDSIPQHGNDSVACITQNLKGVQIDSDAKVPTITFSNCCDGCARSDAPNNTEVVIHLTVPSIESADEARPPI